MSTIVTREGKGSALEWAEVDANFTNLNTDKYQEGSVIGSTTPNAATFTTLRSTGQADLGGISGQESLRVVSLGTATTPMRVVGTGATAGGFFSPGSIVFACGSTQMSFRSGASATSPSAGPEQMRVSHTASAVNYVQVTGAATGSGNYTTISSQGSDAAVNLRLSAKGIATLDAQVNSTTRWKINSDGSVDSGISASGGVSFKASATASQVNYLQSAGGVAGSSPVLSSQGTDTNIALAFQSKGTGAIDLAAGSSGVNISNGGTVTAITGTAGGTGYTSIPTVAVSAPTTAGGVQATATAAMSILTSALAGGGTGYTVNDVLTFVGGTGTAAQVTVTGVSAGVITTYSISLGGTYTALPANPISVTGGTGTGATFSVSAWQVRGTAFTITNAGSGYVEQPTVTFSGGGGSGAAAYATVGGVAELKFIGTGTDSVTNQAAKITTSAGTAMTFRQIGGADTFWQVTPSSAFAALISKGNANASAFIGSNGIGSVRFTTGGDGIVEQARIAHTASAVNYVQVTGAATGGRPAISAQGSDANVGLTLGLRGTGPLVVLTDGSTFTGFVVQPRATNGDTWIETQRNVGFVDLIASSGVSNSDIRLTPKGTGNVRFGTYTGAALSIAGYIEIKDAGGTIRKLAVVA